MAVIGARTSQSVPNLQAPSGCAIPAAPGVVSRRSSHDAPVGAVSRRGARTYCVHDSPASQTNLVFGFGWSALPQRPPRTIENDALDGISASAARTSARSLPAVAAGPRANDDACADRRRSARAPDRSSRRVPGSHTSASNATTPTTPARGGMRRTV